VKNKHIRMPAFKFTGGNSGSFVIEGSRK